MSKPILNRNSNLFFGGMKHCGKTTHGKRYATANSLKFDDLDDLIEALYFEENSISKTVREIYISDEKSGFQKMETKALEKWIFENKTTNKKGVLSLGGGIASNKEAISLIKLNGYFIYLKQDEEVLFKRIKYNGLPPFLKTDNPQKSFHKLFIERTDKYNKIADLIISPGDKSKEDTAKTVALNLTEFLKTENRS